MKKLIIALTSLFVMTVSANAMSYEQARQQALFLTDKMAYELNLTEEQYEAAYEVNLDYLMSVNSQTDLYGAYWQQRNLDLSYILLDWQYRMYVDAAYFYRPLYWNAGYWHFGIYARYPHRDYFYFGRPHFFHVYRGGHSWRMNGGRSWYHGRDFGPRPGNARVGMRDGFNRGDFGRGGSHGIQNGRNVSPSNRNGGAQGNYGGNRSFGNGGSRSIGSNSTRESSTRTTVTRPSGSSFGNSRSNVQSTTPRSTFTPRGGSVGSSSNRSMSAPSRSTSGSFGGGSRGGSFSSGSRGGGGSSSGGSHGGGSFGGRR